MSLQAFQKLKREVAVDRVGYNGDVPAMEFLTKSGERVLGELKVFLRESFKAFGHEGEPTDEFVEFAIGKLVETMKHTRTRYLKDNPGGLRKGGVEKGQSGRGITWAKVHDVPTPAKARSAAM